MNNITKDLLSVGKDVMRILRSHMFDCNIAGGFPRDVAAGKTPRDLDICVFNWHPNDIAESILFDKMVDVLESRFEFVEIYDSYVDGSMASSTMKARQIDKVIKVGQTYDSGMHSIDIIFFEDCSPNPVGMFARNNEGYRLDTIKKVVDGFDCNVNMFIWNEQEDMSEYLGRNSLQSLIVHHDTLSPERILKNYSNWVGFSHDLEGNAFNVYKYLGRVKNA